MPTMPPMFRSSRRPAPEVARREADQRRGSARARGYTSAWDKAADSHRRRSPICIYCEMGAWGEPPRITAASLVDHLIPHRGDQAVFWNKADWISSCKPCHDGPKQAAERDPARLAALANAVRAFLARPRGGVESL